MPATLPRITDLSDLANALGIAPADLASFASGRSSRSTANRLGNYWNSVFGGGRFATGRFGLRSPRNLLEAIEIVADQPRTTGGGSLGGVPQPQTRPAGGFSSRQPPGGPSAPAGGSGQPSGGADSPLAYPYRPYQPSRRADDIDESYFSDEFLAPSSSNVYSFQYFRRPAMATGILYVTFRAHAVKGAKEGRTTRGGRSSKRQLMGGRTGGKLEGRQVGRTNLGQAGSTYAYYGVAPGVFNSMKSAASKGKFVWDQLRIRGTVYGHRYRYSLVKGQTAGTGGKPYIPRRASKAGFVSRSLTEVGGVQGTGQRGFRTSTLAEKRFGTGFSSRGRGGRGRVRS